MESSEIPIQSQLGFLSRSAIYETEKPYSLRFNPPDGEARHNLQIVREEVSIHNARLVDSNLDVNGFALTTVPTRMRYEDFEDSPMIERVYAHELESHLKDLFCATHVKVIDYVVRRRHQDYPISTGKEYEHQQPAGLAHLDFSHEEGINMLRTIYGERADDVLRYRWQIINAWRPLHGPLYDWPLAVCDASTFDQKRDSQLSDAVYPNWAYENVLVHHHPDHKWYYYHALKDSETMLFKCTDSDKASSGGCPHAAFHIAHTDPTKRPRESVESRAFVLWVPQREIPEEIGTVYGKRR